MVKQKTGEKSIVIFTTCSLTRPACNAAQRHAAHFFLHWKRKKILLFLLWWWYHRYCSHHLRGTSAGENNMYTTPLCGDRYNSLWETWDHSLSKMSQHSGGGWTMPLKETVYHYYFMSSHDNSWKASNITDWSSIAKKITVFISSQFSSFVGCVLFGEILILPKCR